MMWAVLCIITLSMGVSILVTDNKTEWTRYMACFLFVAAICSLLDGINNMLIPYLNNKHLISKNMFYYLYWITGVIMKLCEHAIIFFFLMYCVSYSGLFKKPYKQIVTTVSLAVIVFLIYAYPVMTALEKNNLKLSTKYYQVYSLWAVPILVFSFSLLAISYYREKVPAIKKQRYVNIIFVLPIEASIILHLLIFRAIGITDSKTHLSISVFILIEFSVFVYLVLRHGALGIRVRLERQAISTHLESISHGTAIFNHTLKNEVNKISMTSLNIKNNITSNKPDVEDILDNLEVLENSSNYLRNMVNRLKNFSDEIHLKESACSLQELMQQALLNVKPYLSQKDIHVIKYDNYGIMVMCDADYITEVLTNILKNACEAMDNHGTVKIDIYGNQKKINLSMMDNGHGIKKEYLSRVFDPFFTTKQKGDVNFGLGLSYCYRVIQKHNWEINIYSRENSGSTVVITIPQSKIIQYDEKVPQRST